MIVNKLTEYGYQGATIQSYDAYEDDQRKPRNVLIPSNPELPNTFWATMAGEQNWFTLDLGSSFSFDTIKVVNTGCPPLYDGGTKELRFLSVYVRIEMNYSSL